MVVGHHGLAGVVVLQDNVLEIRKSEQGLVLTPNLMLMEHIVKESTLNVLIALVKSHL